jgi:hypothetical protein
LFFQVQNKEIYMSEPAPINDPAKRENMNEGSDRLRPEPFRQTGWILVLLGAMFLLFPIVTNTIAASTEMTSVQIITVIVAGFLILIGIGIEVWRSHQEFRLLQTPVMSNPNDLSLAVEQLAQNYELSRSQTNFAFLITALFMGLGLLVILLGSIRLILGLSDATNTLTLISGVISEFISAGALLIYRSNFNRLNETSTRLYETWKIFAAYKLAQDLRGIDRGNATLGLISALTGVKIEPSPVTDANDKVNY